MKPYGSCWSHPAPLAKGKYATDYARARVNGRLQQVHRLLVGSI